MTLSPFFFYLQSPTRSIPSISPLHKDPPLLINVRRPNFRPCSPARLILMVPAYPLHRELEAVLIRRQIFAANAVTPPVDTTLPAIIPALARHTGHISPPSCATSSVHALTFRTHANPFVNVRPTFHHALPVLVGDQSEPQVVKLDQRSSRLLAQPVLQVRHHRIGHHQWPANLQQRWPFNRLHHAPEVPVVISQIAIPPSARPCFQLHRQLVSFRRVVIFQLLEQRRECYLQRRLHMNFLRYFQRQILDFLSCRNHRFSSTFLL